MAETAKALKVTRKTIYNWAESDPELKEEMEQLKLDRIDFTESQMMKSIKGFSVTEIHKEYEIKEGVKTLVKEKKVVKKVPPSSPLIQFHLKTKGGYTEKNEIDLTSNGQPLKMPTSVFFINPHNDEPPTSDNKG